jgi:hypothetical protein
MRTVNQSWDTPKRTGTESVFRATFFHGTGRTAERTDGFSEL